MHKLINPNQKYCLAGKLLLFICSQQPRPWWLDVLGRANDGSEGCFYEGSVIKSIGQSVYLQQIYIYIC